MSLYVYALLSSPGEVQPGRGFTGEALRVLAAGEVAAVVGEMSARPAVEAEALRGHDAVVRRLAEEAEAILPARFGTWMRDEAELRDTLRSSEDPLREALTLVRGCVQWTLRLSGRRALSGTEEVTSERSAVGAGSQYLRRRLEALRRAQSVPELEPWRSRVESLVRAERVSRQDHPPLLATVYHLVPKEQSESYRERLGELEDPASGVRLKPSGPWPPYSFAPEALR